MITAVAIVVLILGVMTIKDRYDSMIFFQEYGPNEVCDSALSNNFEYVSGIQHFERESGIATVMDPAGQVYTNVYFPKFEALQPGTSVTLGRIGEKHRMCILSVKGPPVPPRVAK